MRKGDVFKNRRERVPGTSRACSGGKHYACCKLNCDCHCHLAVEKFLQLATRKLHPGLELVKK